MIAIVLKANDWTKECSSLEMVEYFFKQLRKIGVTPEVEVITKPE